MTAIARFNEGGEAQLLADKAGLEHSGKLVGLLHDLGKASKEFDRYIHSYEDSSAARQNKLFIDNILLYK